MKTDSKILYILLGIGAGVLAYYLLCKRNNKMITQVSEKEQEGESKTDEGSAGGGKAPTSAIPTSPPKYVTPVATTTPLVVSVTNPEFEPYSGDLLYVENTNKITRADGQAENLKLIVRF